MIFQPLGQLRRDESIEEWLISLPIDVPLLGARLQFIVENLERDGALEEFARAVQAFLGLTPNDRADVMPHLHRNYRSVLATVLDGDVRVRIDSPTEIWKHVRPTEIHVSRRHRRDKKVYVQVAAECDWEPEHGLQLVYREGRELSRVSQQDGHLTHTDACDLPESEDLISEGDE
jgi:hypothetical protein